MGVPRESMHFSGHSTAIPCRPLVIEGTYRDLVYLGEQPTPVVPSPLPASPYHQHVPNSSSPRSTRQGTPPLAKEEFARLNGHTQHLGGPAIGERLPMADRLPLFETLPAKRTREWRRSLPEREYTI